MGSWIHDGFLDSRCVLGFLKPLRQRFQNFGPTGIHIGFNKSFVQWVGIEVKNKKPMPISMNICKVFTQQLLARIKIKFLVHCTSPLAINELWCFRASINVIPRNSEASYSFVLQSMGGVPWEVFMVKKRSLSEDQPL